jgi:hypothetical protein
MLTGVFYVKNFKRLKCSMLAINNNIIYQRNNHVHVNVIQ